MYYPCSENKGADQLRGHREADLRLCFRIGKNPVFSRCGSIHHTGGFYMSRVSFYMRKPDFCLCENNGAEQLCSNCTADQRLCFRYADSAAHLLYPNLKLKPFSRLHRLDCWITKTPKTGFLMTWLIHHFWFV